MKETLPLQNISSRSNRSTATKSFNKMFLRRNYLWSFLLFNTSDNYGLINFLQSLFFMCLSLVKLHQTDKIKHCVQYVVP